MAEAPRYEKVRSIAEANQEQKERYKTTKQTCADFKMKNHVRVICLCQDFYYWNGQTGHVVKIRPDFIYPITIKFDHPINIEWEDGSVYLMQTFNFNPDDLVTFKKIKDLRKEGELEEKMTQVKLKFKKRVV